MDTTPMPASEVQPTANLSPIGRIFGVLFSPKSTFEDIVRKPSWLLPFVIFIALVIAVCVTLNMRMNWREYVSQQIEKSPQAAQLSADQKEQRVEAGAKMAPTFTYVFGIGIQVIIFFAAALIMWGAYSLLGGISTNFSTAMGITAHAFMTSIVSSPLFILILFLKPYGTVDLENPLATNLAVLLPDDSAKWLVALGKSFDIFAFWILILLAVGFAAINPKKLKGAKPFAIAFGVWAIFVVLRVGVAFIMS
ncbi:MAG TPA: YIP1 family protein [Candidatus Acidoferrum sp.]|nr:YIP1 family protein [Candidatus Acidoferrum sp.]